MNYSRSLLILVLVLLALPIGTQAATMSADASVTNVQVGDTITVRIRIDPAGVTINNAEGVLHFPPGVLSVLSVSKTGSLFPLWVEDPSFSNAGGTVSFNGGVPNPGVSSSGTAFVVTFQALQAGAATLSLTDGAVRANDGLGTNVLTSSSGSQVHISAPAAQVIPSVPTPAATAPTKNISAPTSGLIALTITSATHPDQTKWYRNSKPLFAWTLPKNVTNVELGITTSESAAPGVTYKTPISEKVVDELADGTWYFRLRYKLDGSWSPIATYKVSIDTTAPQFTSHDVLYDSTQGAVIINAIATDTGSGVNSYATQIDSEAVKTLPVTAFAQGALTIPLRIPGVHTVTLTVLDAAGNHTSVTHYFSIPQSLGTETLLHIGPFNISLTFALIGMALFSLLSLVIAVFSRLSLLAYCRRRHRTVPTLRKDLHRGFLAMKSSMEQNIRALDQAHSRQELSQEEVILYRKLLKNMNDLEKSLTVKLDDIPPTSE